MKVGRGPRSEEVVPTSPTQNIASPPDGNVNAEQHIIGAPLGDSGGAASSQLMGHSTSHDFAGTSDVNLAANAYFGDKARLCRSPLYERLGEQGVLTNRSLALQIVHIGLAVILVSSEDHCGLVIV